MKDFTILTFEKLLTTLKTKGFIFYTVSDYIHEKPISSQIVLLRHDVEDRYENALRFAKTEHAMGIKGTYYFRFAETSFNASAIFTIADQGHEIGYHYDDLSACKGNYEAAIKRFEIHLRLLQKIAPIQSICMEGAPLSGYNNLDMWNKYNYKDFGISTEAYRDLDFNKMYYLTETGRRWDGDKYILRDKVSVGTSLNGNTNFKGVRYSSSAEQLTGQYHSTFDIIEAIKSGSFPEQVMMTFHPQRWNDNIFDWTKELIFQNIKNQVKFVLREMRGWDGGRD